VTKKRMLADVLWRAANKHLTHTYYGGRDSQTKFSCNAAALAESNGLSECPSEEVMRFVTEAGCNGSAMQLELISDQPNGSDALQGIRYMWLLLAMHVAEDEGIEI
jgi:hypothetical protein